ncbi:hypothetical protein [Streptomyces sp. NBC_01264]|uniref:hypothetical protein n=1 Tax=Streptomyces sp. NBC_01264 TaxID=2903804 RepID=UPI002253C420|nr:hypothetical protein [Streptomyces sp. NBC_01264]MCX4784251.1 hypothetical protein [Streptomyces sp. NBC_01264]
MLQKSAYVWNADWRWGKREPISDPWRASALDRASTAAVIALPTRAGHCLSGQPDRGHGGSVTLLAAS